MFHIDPQSIIDIAVKLVDTVVPLIWKLILAVISNPVADLASALAIVAWVLRFVVRRIQDEV